jgi:hypothetical protein
MGSREDLPGVFAWSGSDIHSDENGGDHDTAHEGNHDKFKGIPKCVGDKKCFVNFRGSTNDPMGGQPSVYGFYTADLSKRPDPNHSRPWILGDDGKVRLEMAGRDQNGDAPVLEMKPQRLGRAMSRALVYFHAPAKWGRPPNFFDPFWHAKLHPFDYDSMNDVLKKVQDIGNEADAVVVVDGQYPANGGGF